jgi:outer membrane protein TolC
VIDGPAASIGGEISIDETARVNGPRLPVVAGTSTRWRSSCRQRERRAVLYIAPTLAPTVVELGVTFSMPPWLRKARGKLAATAAKLRVLEQKRAYARDKAVADVRDAFSMLQAARERVELARGAAEAALEVAEGERERFGLGATTVLFVNLREQAAADAEVAVIDALAEAQVAIARVLTASGESLLE